MQIRDKVTRREFLGRMARGSLSVGAIALAGRLPAARAAGPPAAPANLRIRTSTKALLGQNDFSYLGYYVLNFGGEFCYGMGLAHRYVNGELRFLALGHSPSGPAAYSLYEIPAPALNGTASATSNQWPEMWGGLRGSSAGMYHGLWWSDQTQTLWSTAAVDYPTNSTEESGTGAFVVTTLGNNGAIPQARGLFGLQDIAARRVFGGFTRVPAWFQSQYGVGPYAVGFGGYTSRMTAGPCSLGPVLITMPDPTSLSNNSDVPSSQYKILMDCSAATAPSAWYPGANQPSTYDRGIRTPDVTEDFDNWTSPAPDGKGRWTWGDSALQTGIWIDLPTKHGFLLIPELQTGHCYYDCASGCKGYHGGKTAEFQVYDPADFAQALQGTRHVWNVQPKSIWRAAQFPTGSPGSSMPYEGAGVAATFDSSTNRLYLRWTFYDGDWPNSRDRIFVWQVN